MKKIRTTLEAHYSYPVKIEGTYMGPAIGHVKPVKLHPITGIPMNGLHRGLIKDKENMLDFGDNTKLAAETETSFLKNVHGIDGFEDINEDHVIIQGKIDARIEETVRIQGSVYRYTRKDGEMDYGILLARPSTRDIQ